MFKKLFRPLIYTTIIAIITYVIIVLYGDIKNIKSSLLHFNWIYFAGALSLALLNYILRFIRWSFYLQCIEIKIPLFESFLTFLSGFTVSITPAKMGEVIKSLLLKKTRGIAMAKSVPIVIAERLTDMIAILILAIAGAATYKYGWAVIAITSAVVIFIVLIIMFRGVGEKIIKILVKFSLFRKFEEKMKESYESTYLMSRPERMLWSVLISIFAWEAECLAFFLILRGAGLLHPDILQATFIYAFSTAAGAVAMMPGGLGVTEGGLMGLTILLGKVNKAVASSTTILIRLATLWFAVIVGCFALILYTKLYLKNEND